MLWYAHVRSFDHVSKNFLRLLLHPLVLCPLDTSPSLLIFITLFIARADTVVNLSILVMCVNTLRWRACHLMPVEQAFITDVSVVKFLPWPAPPPQGEKYRAGGWWLELVLLSQTQSHHCGSGYARLG